MAPPPPLGWVITAPTAAGAPSGVAGSVEQKNKPALVAVFVVVVVVIVVFVAGVILAAALPKPPGSAGLTGPPASPTSPDGHLEASYQAAMNVGAVSYTMSNELTVTEDATLGTTSHIVGYADNSSGQQDWTIAHGAVSEQFSQRMVGGVVYVRGNALSLVNELGMTSKQAARWAGTWISMPEISRDNMNSRTGPAIALDVSIPGLWRYNDEPGLDRDTVLVSSGGATPTTAAVHQTGHTTVITFGNTSTTTTTDTCGCPDSYTVGTLVLDRSTNLALLGQWSGAGYDSSASSSIGAYTFTQNEAYSQWGVHKIVVAPASSTPLLSIVPQAYSSS